MRLALDPQMHQHAEIGHGEVDFDEAFAALAGRHFGANAENAHVSSKRVNSTMSAPLRG